MLLENDSKFTVFLPDLPPATMQTRDNLLLLIDGKVSLVAIQAPGRHVVIHR